MFQKNSYPGYFNDRCFTLFLNRSQIKLIIKNNLQANNFAFKGPISQILTPSVVYKYQCELFNKSYYRECIRHLAVKSCEYVCICLYFTFN